MIEYNHFIRVKRSAFVRAAVLLLPVVCIVLLLTQTAFAKNTYVINDGGRVLIHTTYSTDPADVLDEAGLELGVDDIYTTQPGLGMSEITIQRIQIVTILYGGTTRTVSTYGETVQMLLERIGIVLTKEDVVSDSLNDETYDGMVLTISQRVTVEETYTVAVPFATQYCYDASLAEGEQVVLTQGSEGQILCTASVHYADGVEVSRTVLRETVLSESVDRLIAIGTAVEMPAYNEKQDTQEAPAGSRMPVIGDGVIMTPDGQVLTYTDTMQAVATAYHNSDPGCTIYTAIGTYCRVGAIAVDPKVIPYGTRMYIVTNDGKYIYGIAVAEDCGSAIKGARVDLYFDTVEECIIFGIRDCTIYFLG